MAPRRHDADAEGNRGEGAEGEGRAVVIRGLRRWASARLRPTDADVRDYWTSHNVTAHLRFASAQESLDYFHWRNSQYPGYIDLMPMSGFDGRIILDFGCGPGHDLVGFGTYSKPARL